METPSASADLHAQPSTRTIEIRQAAAKLFEARGYSSTTMTDIANAVGVLPGSLYHHFASKEDVAFEIVASFNHEASLLAAALASSASDRTVDIRTRVTRTAEAVVGLSMRNRAAIRLTAYAAPPLATGRFRDEGELKTSGLSKVWKQLVDELVPDADPETQDVGLLRFALDTLSLHASLDPTGVNDPGALGRLIVDMLLDGIVLDVPSDDALDGSAALAGARSAMATWGAAEPTAPPASREHIVNVARNLFASRGFDATTVRDIADAAQVRMGTLYRRVNSKNELLGEILGSYDAHMDAAVRAALTTGESVVESLDALMLVMVTAKRRFRLETEIVKLANPWTTPATPEVKAYWSNTNSRLRLLEAELNSAMNAGILRRLSAPATLARQLRYVSWVPYQDYSRTTSERARRFLRNSVLRGFLTRR